MMTEICKRTFGRELVVIATTFVAAVGLIPPVVAAVAYQSGQAMFWAALTSLYTYFLPYTLLAAAGATVLVETTRLILMRLRRSPGKSRRITKL